MVDAFDKAANEAGFAQPNPQAYKSSFAQNGRGGFGKPVDAETQVGTRLRVPSKRTASRRQGLHSKLYFDLKSETEGIVSFRDNPPEKKRAPKRVRRLFSLLDGLFESETPGRHVPGPESSPVAKSNREWGKIGAKGP